MAGKLSAAQHAVINRKAKPRAMDPADEAGELNIIPFLDIITNVMMFILATITTVFTASLAVPAPSATHGGPPASTDEVNITVKIVREGFIVGAPGGFLQPGCTAVSAAALTVPMTTDPHTHQPDHDYPALTRCMVAIRSNPEWRTELANRHNIQVAVNGDVPYRVLVSTLDALRETRQGANDLFTEPSLGILQ